MKLIVLFTCVAAQVLVANSRVLPDHLPTFCPKSTPYFNECLLDALNKLGPLLMEGIPEIHFPKLNPLNVPLFVANMTINGQSNVFVIARNTQIWGFDSTFIKSVKFDPETKRGELRLHIPQLRIVSDYELAGQLPTMKLGYVGVITNIELVFKFSLKPVERLGVKYYTFKEFSVKSSVGNAVVKMTSKDQPFQFAADLLTHFFNENPKRTIDAVQPIYEESMGLYYRNLAEQILSAIPAVELLPE